MAITTANIKKWWKMLTGKSILHVNQDIGKIFSTNEVLGYYNNLTEKVIKEPKLLGTTELPKLKLEDGTSVFFPVAVFQYGLGVYDLFLQTQSIKYLEKFKQCVEWTITNQEESGAWSNFYYIFPNHPYSAMAQGEGASLLIRAYAKFGDNKYLEAAKKAIDFMLVPIEEGGTTFYHDDTVVLLEYTMKPAVMNGWIFAWWGLYDFVLVTCDEGKYKKILDATCQSLIKALPLFGCSYWSMYDLDGHIASPFYHNLHIAQMQAMHKITNEEKFGEYGGDWLSYKYSFWKPKMAFIRKAIQKIVE